MVEKDKKKDNNTLLSNEKFDDRYAKGPNPEHNTYMEDHLHK